MINDIFETIFMVILLILLVAVFLGFLLAVTIIGEVYEFGKGLCSYFKKD